MTTNTKEYGSLRFFTYFDVAQDTYVGVCFDVGVIKENKNPEELRKELLEAAVGYVEAVVKSDLPDGLLNQHVPQEYRDIFSAFLKSLVVRRRHHTPLPSGIQHPSVFAERVPI